MLFLAELPTVLFCDNFANADSSRKLFKIVCLYGVRVFVSVCRHPIPDYYSVTLEISRARTTAVRHVSCNGRNDVSCPPHYRNTDRFIYRTPNDACLKLVRSASLCLLAYHRLKPSTVRCLKCGWTVMDGFQPLIGSMPENFSGKLVYLVPWMSGFNAKMHQIRLPLGLGPRPRWGSLQRSPKTPSCISGAYF